MMHLGTELYVHCRYWCGKGALLINLTIVGCVVLFFCVGNATSILSVGITNQRGVMLLICYVQTWCVARTLSGCLLGSMVWPILWLSA